MKPLPLSPRLHLHLYPYRYLYLYRYQVLIEKPQREQAVAEHHEANDRNLMPLRPRRNGRDTTEWAHAQVAEGAFRRVPRLLIRPDTGCGA
jgi:hypothetical protein